MLVSSKKIIFKNKILHVLFGIFIVSTFPLIFAQEENSDEFDPWGFYNENVHEIILIAIPSVSAIIISKFVTIEFQKRKERTRIKRKILEEFDKAIVGFGFQLQTFARILWDSYVSIDENTILEKGRVKNSKNNFPTEPNQLPQVTLKDKYLEFAEKINEFYNLIWKFESSLEFYYKDKNLQKEAKGIIWELRPAWFELQKMFFSTNLADFRNHLNEFGNKYQKLQKDFHDFRNKLMNAEIDKSVLK